MNEPAKEQEAPRVKDLICVCGHPIEQHLALIQPMPGQWKPGIGKCLEASCSCREFRLDVSKVS
jgi:hypothetical protein